MDWQIISIILTITLAWSGLLVGAVKWLLNQYQAHIDNRFESLEQSNKEKDDRWQKMERELLELKAALPLEYVRREDAIRQDTVINAKLDALWAKIDTIGGAHERDR